MLSAVLSCALSAQAQSRPDTGPESGSHEFAVWTGGGYTVRGVVTDTAVWNAGARYGWVLSDLHGPGLLRGRLEYAVDAIPVFVVLDPMQTAYGVGVDPVVLRWNFQQRRHVAPYFELSAGMLFTNQEVPSGTSIVNFTPSAEIGISVPRGRFRWSGGLHFLHISNSDLANYNPGVNVLQLRIGFGLFRKHAP